MAWVLECYLGDWGLYVNMEFLGYQSCQEGSEVCNSRVV